jgi:GDP-4-dehydro-6-deoxy-D-mannose reductase
VDLVDRDAALNAVASARPDAVVHLAGRARPGGLDSLQRLLHNNVVATQNVLEAVRRVAPHARVIVASSSAVYGRAPRHQNPVRENRSLHPVLPYGVSKVAVEALCSSYRALGLDVVTVRPFNVAGPGQSRSFVPASFAAQIIPIASGHAEPVVETGALDSVRDFTDVRDVACAYALLVERRGDLGQGPFNVCSGQPRRVGDILELMLRLAGVQAEVRSSAPDPELAALDVPYQCGEPAAIRRALGWRAVIPWEATLKDVLDDWSSRAETEGFS